jgi:flagellar hook-associated protein 3 FlgL
MRVTDKSVFDGASRAAITLRERLQKAVDENTTGLRVEHPWDDPGVTAPLIGHRLSLTKQEAMSVAAERANTELNSTDSALDGITEALTRAHELAIQLSSSNEGAADRTVGATQVRALISDTISFLNTRVGNRYIFAGFKDDSPAFSATGAYLGDSGVRKVESFPGVLTDVSLRGDAIASGATGGPNIIQVLQDFETALSNNDVAGVHAALEPLDDSIMHISLQRTVMGAASNTLAIAANNAKGNVTTEKANISRIAEADIFESASNLALAQRALESALTASSRSFDLTLLNKLR